MSVIAARRGSVREGSPVLRFIVRRSLGALVGIFAASIVIFVGCQLLPGNAASVVLGRNGDPAAVTALNKSLHLDKPARAAVHGLAPRLRARRSRRLRGRARAGREARADLAADLEPRQELGDPRARHRAPDDPALARARGARRRVRGTLARQRHLARLAGGDLAAGVRDRVAARRRLLRRLRPAAAGRDRRARTRARSTARPS